MSADETLSAIAREVGVCTKCPLHLTRTKAVPGEGPSGARVMIVGEGPGSNEDREGRPFVGAAGSNLDELLRFAGLARDSVFITNIVKCRPPGNRRPTTLESDTCHSYLRRQIEAIDPAFIVLLGDTALKHFFPDGTLASLHGRAVVRAPRTFFPTYHPASMLYNPSLKQVMERDYAELGRLLSALG
ncbi:MAG: uracil-DNA glycosylase [Thaumarchaeota archaeon]|nr:uracil-DNA glycosylase [Nitrososphaerota archaeon]